MLFRNNAGNGALLKMELMKEYIVFIPLIVMLAGLTPIVIFDKYIGKAQKRIMLIIIASVALLLVQNCGDYICQAKDVSPLIYRTLFGIMGYCLRPLIILLFCKLIQPEKKHILAWALVAGNALVYMTALFSGIAFYIDEKNHFNRGPLSYTVFYVSIFMLAYLFYCNFLKFRYRKHGIWVTIANELLVIAGVAADLSPLYVDYPVSYLTIFVTCATFFYYNWLHLDFLYEHENALKAEQRIRIMMSQIQPHFLYNTLTTIQSLCITDPQKAFETTGKFGAYLRNNIDSLEQSGLIPLKKELEHTRVYADIEMLRFPKISVRYNIGEDDYSVPVLIVQPLVENAIRHGVRDREQGLVEITSVRTENAFEIIIRDNGAGFEAEKPLSSDGTHIGIKNVRERVEKMCGGTLTIDSRINEGTTVTIRIPRSLP